MKASIHRHRAAASLSLAAALLALLIGASIALAGKGGDSYIGAAGEPASGVAADGGLFDTPGDIAANHDTGQVYVADTRNHRIQRFDADGDFEAAWGRDVVQAGGAGDVVSPNEVQQLTVEATGGAYRLLAPNFLGAGVVHNEIQTISIEATGGTFTLRFPPTGQAGESTDPIPFDAPAATVQAELEALAAIGAGNVSAGGPAGGPWQVEFTGALAETDVELLGGSGSGLTGGSKLITRIDGQYTDPIPFDAPAATVQAELEALVAIGAGNVSVTGVGPFDIEFTGAHAAADVKQLEADSAGLDGGAQSAAVATTLDGDNAFEVCTSAAECRAGRPGSQGGMLATPVALAVDPDTGDLLVTDHQSETFGKQTRHYTRVQRFGFDDNGTPADPSDDLPVFEWAAGSNVIPDGGTGNLPGPNELQRFELRFSGPDFIPPPSGDFTLEFDGQATAPIAWPPSEESIEAALEGLPNLAPGDPDVIDFLHEPGANDNIFTLSWVVEFTGAYADTDVPSLDLDASGIDFGGSLNGAPPKSIAPDVLVEGDSNHEVCTVAAECQAAKPGQTAGAFGWQSSTNFEAAIAVSEDSAPGEGSVFVADPENSRVQQLGIDGNFQRAFGYRVDSGAGSFEICTAASGCLRSDPSGVAGGTNGAFGSESPGHLALDAAGVLYATDGNRVMRFDTAVPGDDDAAAAAMLLPDPYLSHPFNGPFDPAKPLVSGFSRGLEYDPATGNLFYLSESFGREPTLQELDTSSNPPAEVERHMEGGPDGQRVAGLGLLHGSGGDRLYVSSDWSPIDHRILVLTDEGAAPLTADLQPVTGIGHTEATLNAAIDANGPTEFPVSYEFQYSGDGGETWTAVPSGEGPFSDAEEHQVSETLTGLSPAADYLVRLHTTRLFNGSQASAPIPFSTPARTPVVETTESTLRTDTTATLTGRLNPSGTETEWRFEWGTDQSYGNATPIQIASAAAERAVAARIEGLAPGTTYHYRLIADNGEEEAPGDTTIEGEDATVATRPSPGQLPARAYEMVTAPFKVTRSLAAFGGRPRGNVNLAVPSLDGEALGWKSMIFPLTEEVDASLIGDGRISRRGSAGWSDRTVNTLGVNPINSLPQNNRYLNSASSGDLATLAFNHHGGLLQDDPPYSGSELDVPHEGDGYLRFFTRRDGTGTDGFTPWLNNPDIQHCAPLAKPAGCDTDPGTADNALLNDEGTAMARWGPYRGLAEDQHTPGDEDPSDEQQLVGGAYSSPNGGYTAYLVRAQNPDGLPSAPKILINECSGSGAGATELPTRSTAAGAATIETRECADGNVVSMRGAAVGGGRGAFDAKQTALSNDGSRVFFVAPDPGAPGVGSTCTPDTGADTNCPPQLYVRQHGPSGEEFVRWISRSRSEPAAGGYWQGAPIASQRVAQLDGGIYFQRASRDGSVVYFQTKTPLVPDDPNGGESITAGKASDASWDLYRYELPTDRSEDPDGGRLLRVTGGPHGDADPRSSRTGTGEPASMRFLSADGDRAYFLTDEPINGAVSEPPTGGATSPGEAARNLYLFDAAAEGASRWRFIAALPAPVFHGSPVADALSSCSTDSSAMGNSIFRAIAGALHLTSSFNCFRGTPDGSAVILFSNRRLTSDDTDAAADLFLYDAEADELVRISAPTSPTAVPYPCHQILTSGNEVSEVVGSCNAHLEETAGSGFSVKSLTGYPEGSRGWNGYAYMSVAANPDGTVSVFFNSRAQLVSKDTNDDFTDVYEWRDGELSLVTPGNTEKDAWFTGNSLDGEDVFFMTEQRIDPREIDDDDLDFYDARRGGGFPYTPPPEPCDVLGFECEEEAIEAPPARSASSLLTGPPGNVSPPRGKARRQACGRAKLRRGKRCVRKAALARRRCRKLKGKAKRRCIRKQVRRLTRTQKRQQRRAAKRKRGRSR